MKKIILSIMATLLLLTGCSLIQINNSEAVVVQIAAKRVGFYVGQKNPEIAPIAKVMAQGVVDVNNDSDMLKAALNLGIEELVKVVPNDPLLESDLKLIVSTLQINVPDSKLDIGQIKPLVAAFIEGLEIGAAHPR
ncbi:MAG: hypothetical protein WBM23_08375 [Desulfomonilia bacterium]